MDAAYPLQQHPTQRNLRGRSMGTPTTTVAVARLIELETAEHERDILRTNTQTLAMMLRKCAHRLKCNGHEDLSADVVGLLRRYGLLGSPLRGLEPDRPSTPIGWSDTDWLKHLETLRQNEAAFHKGPLPERGWD
jgi:hypothetical protein